MITDPDIFRAASLLIDQHGEDADLRAAERAALVLYRGRRASRGVAKVKAVMAKGSNDGELGFWSWSDLQISG